MYTAMSYRNALIIISAFFQLSSNKDGPRSCRRVRARDERLILREVLQHRRATANPGIAVQLRTRCLVLAVARDSVQSCAVDLPVQRREQCEQ